MKKILTCLSLVVSLLFSYQTLALDSVQSKAIDKLVAALKQGDKAQVADLTSYPFPRVNPLKNIENAQMFIKRFDQVFDEALISMIVNADKDQWETVGSQGIMFSRGTLWLNDRGLLIGVNYQTEKEKQLIQHAIAKQKQHLHSSVQQFERAILGWRTKSYYVRVDEVSEGQYRYAAWSSNKALSDKPDIILHDGDIRFEGSGGNHYYTFKNGQYSYEIGVSVIGCDDSAGDLSVFKGQDRILFQPVIEVVQDSPY